MNFTYFTAAGFLVTFPLAGHNLYECKVGAACDWGASVLVREEHVHPSSHSVDPLFAYGRAAVTIPSSAAALEGYPGFSADTFGVRYFDVGDRTFRISFDHGNRSS